IGQSVTYTVMVTPTGAQPGPLTLVDPIDPALKPGAIKLDGAAVACGAAPAPAGNSLIDCGADGRTITVTLAAGATLSTPLTLEIGATILPLASTQVQNVATLTDAAGATQTVAAPLTVTNATTTGASLTLTS